MNTDYGGLADQYAAHRRAHPGVVEALLAGLRPSSHVLEVGCGTGNYLAAIHASAGSSCAGIDPSKEMLAKLEERGLPIRAIEGRAEELGLSAETFDLVYSVDVIHHVTDRGAAFREAFEKFFLVLTCPDSANTRPPLLWRFAESGHSAPSFALPNHGADLQSSAHAGNSEHPANR